MMPPNLTLKGVPDEMYERFKEAATVNHRSLNSEIIAVLEAKIFPRRLSAQDHLSAIRAARARLKRTDFGHTLLDQIKARGMCLIAVDLNVVAYLLIPGRFTECRSLA